MHTPAPLRAAVLAVLTATSAPTAMAQGGQDCSCRHAGGRVQLGETACLKRGGKFELAMCDMTANNTSWTFLGEECADLVS